MEMLDFMEGENLEHPEKNPLSKDENQQQTQPTYGTGTGNRTRATLVEGECSHHCPTPAPSHCTKPRPPGLIPDALATELQGQIGTSFGSVRRALAVKGVLDTPTDNIWEN